MQEGNRLIGRAGICQRSSRSSFFFRLFSWRIVRISGPRGAISHCRAVQCTTTTIQTTRSGFAVQLTSAPCPSHYERLRGRTVTQPMRMANRSTASADGAAQPRSSQPRHRRGSGEDDPDDSQRHAVASYQRTLRLLGGDGTGDRPSGQRCSRIGVIGSIAAAHFQSLLGSFRSGSLPSQPEASLRPRRARAIGVAVIAAPFAMALCGFGIDRPAPTVLG